MKASRPCADKCASIAAVCDHHTTYMILYGMNQRLSKHEELRRILDGMNQRLSKHEELYVKILRDIE